MDQPDETQENFRPMKRRSTILGRRYSSKAHMLSAEKKSVAMLQNPYWKKDLQDRIEAGRTPEARANRTKSRIKMYKNNPRLIKMRAERMADTSVQIWSDPIHRHMVQCLHEEAKYITPEGHIGFIPVMCKREPKNGVRTGVLVSDRI